MRVLAGGYVAEIVLKTQYFPVVRIGLAFFGNVVTSAYQTLDSNNSTQSKVMLSEAAG